MKPSTIDPRGARNLRDLTPLVRNSGEVSSTVITCAREFAEAFKVNPCNPRLRAIAKAAGCSRNAVKGHLQEAQRQNVLALTTRFPKDETRSGGIVNKYGLADGVVSLMPAIWGDQDSIRSALAPEVMRYMESACNRLAEIRGNDSTVRIGLDGGLTLYKAVHDASVQGFPQSIRYELTPLVFGPLEGTKYTATVVANLLAIKLESRGLTIDVQDAFATKAEPPRSGSSDKHGSRMHFTVRIHSRTAVSQMDLLFVGIGSQQAGLFQREMQLSQKKPNLLREYFGDILNLPFDEAGTEVAPLARGRATLVNLSGLQELAASPSTLVVAAAGGEAKLNALRVALKNKYISVLLTDIETASALAEQQ